ncbi:MAG: AAA family ATPase [Gammaproteobacteria bacterium]|nr:AAA family ATPase [Gammaproteobacteria bacterium]
MQNSYVRSLNLDLPRDQSAILWGARKTGKTTYLRSRFESSKYYDLLDFRTRMRLTTNPSLLGEELALMPEAERQLPVILDEIQKVPELLDEVHRLIETENQSFVLCGSSARKLRRGGLNLLGGRAWGFRMLPLSWCEIPEFDLVQALTRGTLPSVYDNIRFRRSLRAYTEDYLRQEIFAEALTRNEAAFSRFFDALRFCHGEMLNYSAIARECGANSKTVRTYFEILVDTLVGYLIYPFHKRIGRETIVSAPKFYFFDLGIAGYIKGESPSQKSGSTFGNAFEHFIFLELIAARSFLDQDWEIRYWRTKNRLEVDFVLGRGEVALEVKTKLGSRSLRPILAFNREYSPKRSIVVTTESPSRRVGDVEILYFEEFLEILHSGELF